MKIEVNGKEYEVISDYRNGLEGANLEEVLTDFYDEYDYVFGDWAYGKLRLKGFYESTNPKAKRMNDVAGWKRYVDEFCAYGCRYFLIKKC